VNHGGQGDSDDGEGHGRKLQTHDDPPSEEMSPWAEVTVNRSPVAARAADDQCPDRTRLTGTYRRFHPGEEEPYLTFRYSMVRVWQLDPKRLLKGGLPLLALAPISAVTEAELLGIIKQMAQRLQSRRFRKQAPVVWSAAFILLGLRYSAALAAQLFRGVVSMKESSTYQAILEEGRAEGRIEGAVAEARKVLRRLGDKAFGPPDARTAAAIERLDDLAQLEELLDRLGAATNWQALPGQPAPGRRSGRRREGVRL
jgi:predicted transposase YdaD